MTDVRPARHPVQDRVRHAPVERGLRMEPIPSADGGLGLRAPLHDGVRDEQGRPAPVLTALLADSGIGFLVFTKARLTAGAPTVDLRIDHLGPAAAEATALEVSLTLLHLDDEVGVGRADVRDDTGRAVAHAVATMSLAGVPSHPGALAANGDPAGERSPDPGTHRPRFDPARLEPANLETDGDGEVVFVPGPTATNLNGSAHGAVLAGLARGAVARTMARTTAGDAAGQDELRVRSESIEYLRPVPLDGPLRVRTAVVRSGRRFWTTRAEMVLPGDRVAVRSVVNGTRRIR